MEKFLHFVKAHKVASAVFMVFLLIILMLITRGSGVTNPAKDKLNEDPRAGKDYALLYKNGELYNFIGQSKKNLKVIQKDLVVFVRNTETTFKDSNVLVGFTLDKGFKKNGKEGTFTGHYYSLKDKIELKVTLLGNGVIRLSVTNLKTKKNVDEKLNLNGPRNKFIDKLPIEKDYFSIKYKNTSDEIIVTFYDGYSQADIDSTVGILKDAYGKTYKESDFTFSLNALGIFTLEQVTENLTTDPILRD